MEPFETLTAIAAPYPPANVDTDRIIRVERCVRTPREEMGRWAFEMERYDAAGREVPGFFANRPAFREARILVAGENFGCGSSREMAVWAIAGLGIRCVIAPSFGEIFRGNCFQNGLLPVRLPAPVVAAMLARLEAAADGPDENRTLAVDLRTCRIDTPWGESHAIEIEPLRREALLEGLDAIGLTLRRGADIDRFQAWQRQARPWVYRG